MHATALFPPQDRDWSLPAGVPLTSLAAEKLSRGAAQESFENTARNLSLDWHLGDEPLDKKQVQRWSERLGREVVAQRSQEVAGLSAGVRPEGPLNPPPLLVLGLDGGRVQMREKDSGAPNRWKEDKVASFTSYLPGDGQDKKPRKLVTTYVATMQEAHGFGPMVAAEAYRRGLWQTPVVLNISDAGNWIDPLSECQGLADVRIIDFYHADQRLFAMAAALLGKDTPEAMALGKKLEGQLYEGQVQQIIAWMQEQLAALGPPRHEGEGPGHVREVLRQNLGYFQAHREHMRYDEYRRKGWPIGSGNVEAGVKGFNHRIKGTDQFWSQPGAEAILALRALWLSQDQRWERYWNHHPAYRLARAA